MNANAKNVCNAHKDTWIELIKVTNGEGIHYIACGPKFKKSEFVLKFVVILEAEKCV